MGPGVVGPGVGNPDIMGPGVVVSFVYGASADTVLGSCAHHSMGCVAALAQGSGSVGHVGGRSCPFIRWSCACAPGLACAWRLRGERRYPVGVRTIFPCTQTCTHGGHQRHGGAGACVGVPCEVSTVLLALLGGRGVAGLCALCPLGCSSGTFVASTGPCAWGLHGGHQAGADGHGPQP